MPQKVKSNRQAIRIPQSSRLKCRRRSSRTGRPHEYPKVPDLNAAEGQVELAGRTNTSKFRTQMPQKFKSNRQATRIPQSPGLECRKISSRTGRPHEYLKVPDSNAAEVQVEPAGHTNTSKSRTRMPQNLKSYRQATRIPQSSGLKCRRSSSRIGRPNEYFKVSDSNATKPQVEPAGKKKVLL